MQRGRAEEGTRYAEFVAAVNRAEADAVRRLHIRVAASNPQWILERRHPTLYGPPKTRVETELTGADGGPIEMETKGGEPYKVIISCTDVEGLKNLFPIISSQTGQPIEPPNGTG
jgi:hypothetical protein